MKKLLALMAFLVSTNSVALTATDMAHCKANVQNSFI